MSPEADDQRTESVRSNSPSPGGEPPRTNLFLNGFLSLFICHPMGIIVWIQGNRYISRCRELGVEPNSQALAGRMLGKISTLFMIVVIVGFIVMGFVVAFLNRPDPMWPWH